VARSRPTLGTPLVHPVISVDDDVPALIDQHHYWFYIPHRVSTIMKDFKSMQLFGRKILLAHSARRRIKERVTGAPRRLAMHLAAARFSVVCASGSFAFFLCASNAA
jgi:hypothetical protein